MKSIKKVLKQLQTEHKAWAERNFPGAPDTQSFFGMVEELGEMADSLTLIMYKDSKGFDHFKDAIADIIIFMAHFANANNIDMSEFNSDISENMKNGFGIGSILKVILHLQSAIGQVAHAHLKKEQGIRIGEDHNGKIRQGLENIVALLKYLIEDFFEVYIEGIRNGVILADVVWDTWQEVKKRDWIAYPKNGLSE